MSGVMAHEAKCLLVMAVFLLFNIDLCTSEADNHPDNTDPNGYILYCPCMGRFGNQADQFLGTLGFAHALNRTLVLPAWVEYRPHKLKSEQVPFDTYFKVEPLREYHRVLTMETFMKELAPTVWPPGKRISFCHSPRGSLDSKPREPGCHAKEGNPFGPFWDTYNVDFDQSAFYSPLYYNINSPHEVKRWIERFAPNEYPVMAFTGPPAAFPVEKQCIKLQKYLQWSDNYAEAAARFISDNIPLRPFLGIHLRNGIDFKNACEHVKTSGSLFASAQCTGYRNEFGTLTQEMCFPSVKSVVKQVKEEVKQMGAQTVFIATDSEDWATEFNKAMKKVNFVRQPAPADPMLDLAILGQADHFIGNCISSFTAFVKRERDVAGRSSSFWAFKSKLQKEEL